MTPLHFEQLYSEEWNELAALLDRLHGKGVKRKGIKPPKREPVPGDRLAVLYRRACEQLALARARSYPAYLVDRLEQLTADAHQAIYQRRELGWSKLRKLAAVDFPQAVRDHAVYVWVATAVFWVPTLALGFLVYFKPELVLAVIDAEQAASFEGMYSKSAESIGRLRTADTDWTMFGFYIRNNIGVAFQCFASGLFAGIGSLFFLAVNGALGGAVAGYLAERGLGETFFSFVSTHAAFELTAIVLSGAAGLRIGHSLLAPGRRTRVQALVVAARESVVIIYGVVALLVIAAFVEAFWSSSSWVTPLIKYVVAGICWIAVIGYLTLQGRNAR